MEQIILDEPETVSETRDALTAFLTGFCYWAIVWELSASIRIGFYNSNAPTWDVWACRVIFILLFISAITLLLSVVYTSIKWANGKETVKR